MNQDRIIVTRKTGRVKASTIAFKLSGLMSKSVPFASQDVFNTHRAKRSEVLIPPTLGAIDKLGEWCDNHNVSMLLSEAVEEFLKKLKVSQKRLEVPTYVAPSRLSLYPHQEEGIDWLLKHMKLTHNGSLLGLIADDPRLGKSITAITALATALNEDVWNKHKFILVLCPKPIVHQWKHYFEEWFPKQDIKDIVVLSGSKTDREFTLAQLLKDSKKITARCTVVITNYHTLYMRIADFKDLKWWALIADEAHVLKNRKAKLSKVIKEIKSEHKLLLSATFTESTSAELWQPLHIVSPRRFGSYWNFARLYSDIKTTEFSYEVSGSRNRGMMKEVLEPYYIRRTSEVLGDKINAKIRETWYCEADLDFDKALKVYEAVENDTIIELSEGFMNITSQLARLTRLRQVAIHQSLIDKNILIEQMTLDDLKLSPKLMLLEQLLAKHIPQDEQVIVYSSFIDGARLAKRLLDPYGKAEMYAGATGDEKTIQAFKNNEFRILCATPQRGGVGLTLNNADWIVYLDQPWSSILLRQSEDRTRAMGKSKPTTIIKLVLKNTVDEVINQLLSSKLEEIGEKMITQEVVKYLQAKKKGDFEL